jgi:hypothetical protein
MSFGCFIRLMRVSGCTVTFFLKVTAATLNTLSIAFWKAASFGNEQWHSITSAQPACALGAVAEWLMEVRAATARRPNLAPADKRASEDPPAAALTSPVPAGPAIASNNAPDDRRPRTAVRTDRRSLHRASQFPRPPSAIPADVLRKQRITEPSDHRRKHQVPHLPMRHYDSGKLKPGEEPSSLQKITGIIKYLQ